jgi:YesN/AraC family two-component response regulator
VIDSGVPEEALRIAQQYAGTLPLLITDVVMPGMSALRQVLGEKTPPQEIEKLAKPAGN